MAFFKWKDSFSVGDVELDWQHQEFLGCLNECYELASSAPDLEIPVGLVERLKEYMTKHFTFEEQVLQRVRYPGLEQQRQQHAYFASLLVRLRSFRSGGHRPSLEDALSELRDWFLTHILVEDRKYAPYLNTMRA